MDRLAIQARRESIARRAIAESRLTCKARVRTGARIVALETFITSFQPELADVAQ